MKQHINPLSTFKCRLKPLLAIVILSMLTPLFSQAQLATGTWKQYPIQGKFTDMIDTGKKLWYVTGGCLYSYDYTADETRFHEGLRDLTDHTVKFARYYPKKEMLAVIFTNGNIDIIQPDGTVVNLSDIKDAIVNVDRKVNNVAFDGDDMYVATGFGLVIYDLNRLEVKESGIYNVDLSNVFLTPSHIYVTPSLQVDYLRKMMRLDRSKSIKKYSDYEDIGGYYGSIDQVEPMDDTYTRFALIHEGQLGFTSIREDGTLGSTDWILDNGNRIYASAISVSDDGVKRFITSDGKIGHYTEYNKIEYDATLPTSFNNNIFASTKGLSSFWLGGLTGLGRYSIGSDGKLNVLRDKTVPTDALTFGDIANIFPTNDPTRFYIANIGMTRTNPMNHGNGHDVIMKLNMFSRDYVENIDPQNVSITSSNGQANAAIVGNGILSPTQIAEDPDYPERLYVGSGAEGLYVLENGEELIKLDSSNAPINYFVNWCWPVTCVSIDPDGNLWVGSHGKTGEPERGFIMLPAEKRRVKDFKNVKRSDWIKVDYADAIGDMDLQLLHCTHSNMMFSIQGTINQGILAVNTKGTRSNTKDDTYVMINATDQDGKTFQPSFYNCMVEDNRGHVWFGTSSGVISFTNPSKACDSDFRINRIKVPRNDGSGLADYLLESDAVTAIAVDNSNRKWIATESSGLYLVNEDGDEIISHFTTSNSMLPSNTVTALYVDPQSNSIFVGTPVGLYEYASSSGPAKPDYSDVYAYPNPVTPDYSGWITITGLMDNSLVKIVDSSMALVYQTSSEGGTALWDGCTLAGERVRSGVYYVLVASSHQPDSSPYANTSSKGDVVAKIMVVN